jgi:hypothetical protein
MSTEHDELARIRERLNAASKGPWQAGVAATSDGSEVCTTYEQKKAFLALSLNDGDRPLWIVDNGEVIPAATGDGPNAGHNAEFIAHAPTDVAYLLAELRKAHEALARVEALHRPAKIYDECECPEGTHPDEYDYIDCDSYAGCENSLIAIGCEECCVDGDGLSERCGDSHTHTLDPDTRCQTVTALRAAVIEDMEDIIDPLLMRKKSGKYIAEALSAAGFGLVADAKAERGWLAKTRNTDGSVVIIGHFTTEAEAEKWARKYPASFVERS